MDQLSIDSTTNEKLLTLPEVARKMAAPEEPQGAKHFKIDWRKLTYFQKEASFFSKKFGSQSSLGSSKLACQKQQPPLSQRSRRRTILNSLDGCFKSGELSAILGPSGAGKTTFLSALFGNKQETAFGQTRVTWFSDAQHTKPLCAGAKLRRPIRIAILPQHDHLLNHLTVYETLMFASKIKNPTLSSEAPLADKKVEKRNFHRQNVKRVAKMLKLNDCLDTRCGKLSGGQHKRVSIGQELLSQPDVIILDEPTSGLDATTCLSTIRTLKSIASKHPISIILTIHQPDVDVFNLFDKVYVIAQGGTAIFEGRPGEIVPTLAQVGLKLPSASYNPARFIVENAFVPELGGGGDSLGATCDCDEATAAQTCHSSENETSSDDDDLEKPAQNSVLARSLLSLSDVIGGKELASPSKRKGRDSGRKPLLQIGIQTSDGKLVTSEQLVAVAQKRSRCSCNQTTERLDLIRRLNELQKERYGNCCDELDLTSSSAASSSSRQRQSSSSASSGEHTATSSSASVHSGSCNELESSFSKGTNSFATELQVDLPRHSPNGSDETAPVSSTTESNSVSSKRRSGSSSSSSSSASSAGFVPKRRQFDKQLSAKHCNSKRQNYPVFYHTLLLAHRTWLSIVRDPVFFGIQFCMHTTIPILLALIFGSQQEEGCPQIGPFDLVQFAYGNGQDDEMIAKTVSSIRKSIGNIGIVFFEMFVLSFAINCITALVFPLDMYVLLKEYRNGWYSLRSYFFGRTLADLPVPVALHSMAMAILYYLTGQPFSVLRFGGTLALVVLASLIAQSVGLTVGALLMKSSQSAVLAAAGLVAPFFALSGFIVRIHTLPVVAQLAAQSSYLYHLLNGFIILRYGFQRCDCSQEDFERDQAHQIPQNLRTMASIWIGTYSNEFDQLDKLKLANRTNVDPNIDVVGKMLNAFKLANSYGHKIETCDDVLPYAMLDFNLRDSDIYLSVAALVAMLLISRLVTFCAIYHKIRSFA